MKVLFSSLFLAISWVISAQPKMFNGVIVNDRLDVIVSQVAVEAAFDALIYKSKIDTSAREILPAHRVKSFRYFDADNNINRQFLSLRHDGIYRFYEVVIYGELQVLRRLKRNVQSWEADEGHDYDFFCWFRGDLVDLKKFKSVVFPLLVQNYGRELEEFVAQNKLHLHEAASIFSIIKEYNQYNTRQHLIATR